LHQSAVVLARVLGFIEIADILSGAKISVPEIVKRLTAHYVFQKFPQTIEELDPSKGIEFLVGSAGDIPIMKFVIWPTAIVVETRISTDASKSILEEALNWGARELGLNYKTGSIKRFAYISDVTFFSDAPLLEVNPAVSALAARTSEEVSRIWREPVRYESIGVRVGHDPLARKNGIANFSIERRSDELFSEGKYFSEAPVPTHIHWEMLEQYEKDILLQSGKAGRV
jgi:hypothetical protein